MSNIRRYRNMIYFNNCEISHSEICLAKNSQTNSDGKNMRGAYLRGDIFCVDSSIDQKKRYCFLASVQSISQSQTPTLITLTCTLAHIFCLSFFSPHRLCQNCMCALVFVK